MRLLLVLLSAFTLAACSASEPAAPPSFDFEPSALTAMEDQGAVDVTVELMGEADGATEVTVAFEGARGTAEPADFGGFTEGTVTFPAGAEDGARQTLSIPVTEDDLFEGEETAFFVLVPPGGGQRATSPEEAPILQVTLTDAFDFGGIAEPDWATQVQPFLAARCGTCHGGDDPEAGLDVTDWDALVAGSDFGGALVPFDPDGSLMVRLATALESRHPAFEAHRLPEEEVEFLKRWIAEGAPGPGGEVPFADAGRGRLYVPNQMGGRVSVVDLDALVVARTVELGMPMMTNPHDTAVEPDGSAWYVTLISANAVRKYSAPGNELLGEARLPDAFKPGMLALDGTSDLLWSGRSFSDQSGIETIAKIDRTGMTWEEIPVPRPRPHPLALTRDGRYVLSGSLADNVADALDAETGDLVSLIEVDDVETALVHYDGAPDGRHAVLTGQQSGMLYVLDITDPEDIEVVGMAEVGQQPWHPVYHPGGDRVFVPNRESNTVSVVDVSDPSSPQTTGTLDDERLSMPHGSAITDDGGLLFISNANLAQSTNPYGPRYPFDLDGDGTVDNAMPGAVVVIDTATMDVVKVLEVGPWASGLSLWQP